MVGESNKRILIHGCGTAGTALIDALCTGASQLRAQGRTVPTVQPADNATWQKKHVACGLIAGEDEGEPKAITAARRLREAGWPVEPLIGDVRHQPRGAYRNAIAIAATDTNEGKCASVRRSLQAGSPSIAMGLGPDGATVEVFAPGGAGYCCVHGSDPIWNRRVPCDEIRPISTTALVLRGTRGRQSALAAGALTAKIALRYVATGRIIGDRGALCRGGEVTWFGFAQDPACEGPHDPPIDAPGCAAVRIDADPAELPLGDALARLGRGARYADRVVAWMWRCTACRRDERRVHTVFPPMACARCGRAMRPGPPRASGLTAAELLELHGPEPLSVGGMGLGGESILRCTNAKGDLTWLILSPHRR